MQKIEIFNQIVKLIKSFLFPGDQGEAVAITAQDPTVKKPRLYYFDIDADNFVPFDINKYQPGDEMEITVKRLDVSDEEFTN